jgi:hypothetical protein
VSMCAAVPGPCCARRRNSLSQNGLSNTASWAAVHPRNPAPGAPPVRRISRRYAAFRSGSRCHSGNHQSRAKIYEGHQTCQTGACSASAPIIAKRFRSIPRIQRVRRLSHWYKLFTCVIFAGNLGSFRRKLSQCAACGRCPRLATHPPFLRGAGRKEREVGHGRFGELPGRLH